MFLEVHDPMGSRLLDYKRNRQIIIGDLITGEYYRWIKLYINTISLAQKCEAPANGTRFDEPQSLYPTTDLVMNNIHTIKCNTENVINSR